MILLIADLLFNLPMNPSVQKAFQFFSVSPLIFCTQVSMTWCQSFPTYTPYMHTHTFLRWPLEQHSWATHSLSSGTPRLTSCLTALLANHKPRTRKHTFVITLIQYCWTTPLFPHSIGHIPTLLILFLWYKWGPLRVQSHHDKQRQRVTSFLGSLWFLYPAWQTGSLSSKHRAHLIGSGVSSCHGPQPYAKHQTLSTALTPPFLSLIPLFFTLPLSLAVHQRPCSQS